MLVLTRKVGQRIVIGEITIEVVEVRGKIVKLGFQAPETTRIYREEVIREQKGGDDMK